MKCLFTSVIQHIGGRLLFSNQDTDGDNNCNYFPHCNHQRNEDCFYVKVCGTADIMMSYIVVAVAVAVVLTCTASDVVTEVGDIVLMVEAWHSSLKTANVPNNNSTVELGYDIRVAITL